MGARLMEAKLLELVFKLAETALSPARAMACLGLSLQGILESQ